MIKKLCIVLLVFSALNIHAQEGTTSPYSFYGLGNVKFRGTTENKSMGGLSIYSDSIHMNFRNPASLGISDIKSFGGDGKLIKFTLGGEHRSVNLKTTESSDKASASTFDYLGLSFPVGKLGVSIGLLPYSSVGYSLQSNRDDGLVEYRYRGEGGLNKAILAVGYPVLKNLNVGLDAQYNFGTNTNAAVHQNYDSDNNPLQYQSREINESELSGLNFDIGLTYTPMINDKFQLTTALTYRPKTNLSSINSRNYATIVVSPSTGGEFIVNEIEADLDAEGLGSTKLALPSKIGFGAGIGQPRIWFVGAEYNRVNASEFKNDLFTIEGAQYNDSNAFALGGFVIPRYNSFNSYWKRIVYRAGVRFENTGLELKGESINEFGISFGVGLPVGDMFSNANIGFEYGSTGTTNAGLVKENFFNFSLSLSLNDRWFRKRKYN
ncbi:MAG: hypothetical protein KC469_08375 [Flavobacteriaceae bacterium]|nr:hypothetical protein [Flavobacteriaceae bacterium]